MLIGCLDVALAHVLIPLGICSTPRVAHNDPELETAVEAMHALLGEILVTLPPLVRRAAHFQ